MHRIYLDHNATTPLDPTAFAAMEPFLKEAYGNASSLHWAGAQAKRALEKARGQVATLIGAQEKEIFFTSGATESINTVLKGLLGAHTADGGHLILSAVEHHASLDTAAALATGGVSVTQLPVDPFGCLDPQSVRDSLTEETRLVSLLWANNETGTIFRVREIAEACRQRGILIHLDAAQAAGKVPIDIANLPVDFLSLSAHKLYGPKGVGAVFIREGRSLPRLLDGGEQERKHRSGTENVAGIVGFGVAAQIAQKRLHEDRIHSQSLIDRLEAALRTNCTGMTIFGDPDQRLPNTLTVAFPDIESEALLIALDLEGIAVSSGSACASGAIEPSHVLLAMGATEKQARSAIRFSVGRANTVSDIDTVATTLPRVLNQLAAA